MTARLSDRIEAIDQEIAQVRQRRDALRDVSGQAPYRQHLLQKETLLQQTRAELLKELTSDEES